MTLPFASSECWYSPRNTIGSTSHHLAPLYATVRREVKRCRRSSPGYVGPFLRISVPVVTKGTGSPAGNVDRRPVEGTAIECRAVGLGRRGNRLTFGQV